MALLAGFGVSVSGDELLPPSTSVATKIKWEFLVEGGKCTSLEQIHQIISGVVGGSNPEEVFLQVRNKFPDAQMRLLVDVVAEDHKKSGTKLTANESDYYKPFVSDVFVLSLKAKENSSTRDGAEIVILSDVLCKRMYSLIQKHPE